MSAPGHGRTGDPLVLLHGFAGTWRSWSPILEELRRHHPVLAVRLAGHYEARPLPPDEPLTVSAVVDAAEADMDAVGVEKAHLVGHSFGGWIAFELAKRGRALSVVGISPDGGFDPDSPQLHRLEARLRSAHLGAKLLAPYSRLVMRAPWRRRLLMMESFARAERVDPDDAAHLLRAFAWCPRFDELLDAMRREGPVRDLDQIDSPVRLIWGTRDRDAPIEVDGPHLLAGLRAPDLVLLPDVGHMAMADDPGATARAILEFTTGGTPPEPSEVRITRGPGTREFKAGSPHEPASPSP
jgi:pimeloyl-ACP methyl ester carboxylesterase